MLYLKSIVVIKDKMIVAAFTTSSFRLGKWVFKVRGISERYLDI